MCQLFSTLKSQRTSTLSRYHHDRAGIVRRTGAATWGTACAARRRRGPRRSARPRASRGDLGRGRRRGRPRTRKRERRFRMHQLDRRRGPRPLLAGRLGERDERRRCAGRALCRAAPRLRRGGRAERGCEWPLRDAHMGGPRPVEACGISERARRGAHRGDGGEAGGDAQGARGGWAGARGHLRLMSSNWSIPVDQLDQHAS